VKEVEGDGVDAEDMGVADMEGAGVDAAGVEGVGVGLEAVLGCMEFCVLCGSFKYM
jgi:hypothetical protein